MPRRLNVVLARKGQGRPSGLHFSLQEAVKKRSRDGRRRDEGHVHRRRHRPPAQAVGPAASEQAAAADDFGTVASGSGGGDPGGGSGGAALGTSAPPPPSHAQLDPRTRTLNRHLGTLALAARRLALLRKEPPSVFQPSGAVRRSASRAAPNHRRARAGKVPQSHQAKRDAIFERQLVAARKLLDIQRQLRTEAEVQLMYLALAPQRDRRALEQERVDAAAFQRQAAAAIAETQSAQLSGSGRRARCLRCRAARAARRRAPERDRG